MPQVPQLAPSVPCRSSTGYPFSNRHQSPAPSDLQAPLPPGVLEAAGRHVCPGGAQVPVGTSPGGCQGGLGRCPRSYQVKTSRGRGMRRHVLEGSTAHAHPARFLRFRLPHCLRSFSKGPRVGRHILQSVRSHSSMGNFTRGMHLHPFFFAPQRGEKYHFCRMQVMGSIGCMSLKGHVRRMSNEKF